MKKGLLYLLVLSYIYLIIGYGTAACDCGSTSSAAPCEGQSVSLTRGDSTITFDFQCNGGDCYCGKFANEYDYWVSPKQGGSGVVEITRMMPDAYITTPQSSSDTGLRNGWISNPIDFESHGMDGRYLRDDPADHDYGIPIAPSSSIPYVINTTAGGWDTETILKGHSANTGGNCRSDDTVHDFLRMCYYHVEVLTVLGSVPSNAGSTVMRPAYFGTDKSLVNVSEIHFERLPEMPVPERPAPGGKAVLRNWDSALSALESVKPDWGGVSISGNEGIHPYFNLDELADSGRTEVYLGPYYDNAFQILFEASGADIAKRDLLRIHFVQYGLDILSMIKYGAGKPGDNHDYGGWWPAAGGYGMGRYAPALITAALIDNKGFVELMNDRKSSALKRQTFANTNQIFPGQTQVLYGCESVAGGRSYATAKCRADPNGLADKYDGGCPGEYQGGTFPTFWAEANMIRLVPAAKAIAWQPFLDYVARITDLGPDGGFVGNCNEREIGRCIGGPNDGWVMLASNDVCPGATASAGDSRSSNASMRSPSENSWSSMNAWYVYDDCYLDCSCTGMEGLCNGGGPGPVCNNGEQRNCSNQTGVCSRSYETCTNENWPGCNYNSIPDYESTETSCSDGLDNDCDGAADSVDTVDCPTVPPTGDLYVGGHEVDNEFYSTLTSECMDILKQKGVLFTHTSTGMNMRNALFGGGNNLEPPYDELDIGIVNEDRTLRSSDFTANKFVSFVIYPTGDRGGNDRVDNFVSNFTQFSNYLDLGFTAVRPGGSYQSQANYYISEMQSLMASYTNKKFFYTTQLYEPEGRNFNENVYNNQFNEYLKQQLGDSAPLYDLGDIESTRSDGTVCTFESGGTTYRKMCDGYSSDEHHANQDVIEERLAKGILIMMAKLFCDGTPQCTITESPEVSCSDGLDNDCDGQIDGLVSDCGGVGDCHGTDMDEWDNFIIDPTRTGIFQVEFYATPNSQGQNSVIMLSDGQGSGWSDYAVLVRFNRSNSIDARDGGIYTYSNYLSYTPNVEYHFELIVDVDSHTYSVYVTPENGSRTQVAENFDFRTEQNNVSELNNWAIWSGFDTDGLMEVCNFTIGASTGFGDLDGNGIVDVFDLVIIGKNFGNNVGSEHPADTNGDGWCGVDDLYQVANNFGIEY